MFLAEFITDFFRQGLPIVGAVTGAYYGSQRSGSGVKKLGIVAGFAGGGWVAGYLAKAVAAQMIDKTRALPTVVLDDRTASSKEKAPMVKPQIVSIEDTKGLEDAIDISPEPKKGAMEINAYGGMGN